MTQQQMQQRREERGHAIAVKGINNEIKQIGEHLYKVRSQSGKGWYRVVDLPTTVGLLCECADTTNKLIYTDSMVCKHVQSIFDAKKMTDAFGAPLLKPIRTQKCLNCNSEDIVKEGFTFTKEHVMQRYNCNDCDKYFNVEIADKKIAEKLLHKHMRLLRN